MFFDAKYLVHVNNVCVDIKIMCNKWASRVGKVFFSFRGGHGLPLEAALIFIDYNRSGVDLLTIIGTLSFCNDAGLKCRDRVSVACHVDSFIY